MAIQPTPKPQAPAAHSPQPQAKPEAAKGIGAKPDDPKDPQAVKFAPPTSAPPRWDEHPKEAKAAPDWTPKPALDPRAEKAPEGVYADGMDVATEQRLRAAKVEEIGLEKYDELIDQRTDEKPKFDKAALSGGGAFVSAAAQHQVPGVTPPTKRE